MTSKWLGKVPATPVKTFFVHMLTRDISLHDAILDLLDNCVDGVQRSATKRKLERKRPYAGYWAKISFTKDEFKIIDNCGGIPWELHEYAFLMGAVKRSTVTDRLMIGTYGIGMKRAIFKIGGDCTIKTHAKDASYMIRISPEWMEDASDWDLDAERIEPQDEKGTCITVTHLREAVSHDLNSKTFRDAFYESIATHYSYIIEKGFSVSINGLKVIPKHIRLLFSNPDESEESKDIIRPFVYQALFEGVHVFLAVGFTRDIPSKEEADNSLGVYKERYSSADAGWTIVCNDRIVLYCDKTALTGWGVSGVPQYHMQFIAISGIVIFTADNASLLPMTTTKRGIQANSVLYLHVRDKMIEGMKIFTNYTNVWKSKELVSQSRSRFRITQEMHLTELQTSAKQLKMTSTRGVIKGEQYKPVLPKPISRSDKARITFERPSKEVRLISKYLFDTSDKKPAEVGEACFDMILEETTE